VKGFRKFLNTEWFDGTKNCPVGRFKGIVMDKIGLWLLLLLLALLGWLVDGRGILVGVGIIAADVVQHALFSFGMKRYTPGLVTCVLYVVCIAYVLRQPSASRLADDVSAWAALAVGGAFIGGNYMSARRKMRRGDCGKAAA
jgi:hypothetical protein